MAHKKILFVAEAVTLAHVGRPLALAQSLDRHRFDIHFACADGYDFCFEGSDIARRRIESISSAQFLAALAAGKPVYSAATLNDYVSDDLRLLKTVGPDLVLGDFRLSLSVSARLARVPYAGLTNAYWSPYVRQRYTVPALPLTRLLPVALADPLFRLVRPLAFAAHSVPLNRIRRKYGLASLGADLRRVYTDADHVLYADIPELFPAHDLPVTHHYLGPVIWSPPMAPPAWWDALPAGAALAYVTLGSSGQGRLLPQVLQALAPLPLTVLAASAGASLPEAVPANARVAPYLPGAAAAQRASLVICNGGSPTSQQALAAGVPVLGIAGNLDQFLNMQGIVAAGAGILLRADRFSPEQLRAAASAMLGDAHMAQAARRLALTLARYHAATRLTQVLETMLER